MKLPDRLARILERNQELDGLVKSAISRFEPWIKHSQLPFFPEYTDHGLDHLERVIATASSLIRDEAWAVLTPADAAVTILSVLLHDCAMHLSEDGFIALLYEPWRDRIIADTGDRPWHVVWDEFLGEASRFDGKKLKSLFGDAVPARRPPLDPSKMDKRDRLLIGEFLRRHHPRLAHEIVEFGVPVPSGNPPLTIADLSTSPVRELAGIVARSHGEPIRRFLPLLESRYGKGGHRECHAVHPTFLMALVRVADYMQVQSERAPKQVLSVRCLASPVSRREWRAHSAIHDVRQTSEDPEALHIEARPPDVETFFRVSEWISGIQSELDASWAVLGEVYGRYSELAPLGLILRRVRSNIEDVAVVSAKLDFLPRRAAFRAADADLLKLLMSPLYGDNPAIGMRELIQNAVDAVRELNVLLADRGLTRADLPLAAGSADVVASIERDSSGQHWVTVNDSGLGMAADVIVNYFLTAGASFRRSDDWRKSFETPDGKSRVLRAGRFGIGALAAFLLGNEIHVTTRHVDSPTGIAFSAELETEFVELKKCERLVGTSIRIPVSNDVAVRLGTPHDVGPRGSIAEKELIDEDQPVDDEDFRAEERLADGIGAVDDRARLRGGEERTANDWDWYCLAAPSLDRIAMGKRLGQQFAFYEDLGSNVGWRRIDFPDYDGVFWTYLDAPSLACNGIVVPRRNDNVWCAKWGLECPNLQVRDPNGVFPLNLQRSEMQTKDFPFADNLGLDVARSFCGFALSKFPYEIASLASAIGAMNGLRSPHLPRTGPSGISEWFFSAEGACFFHPRLFRTSGCQALLIVRVGARSGEHPHLRLPLVPTLGYMVADRGASLGVLDYWIREITNLPFGDSHFRYDSDDRKWERVFSFLGQFERTGTRVLLPKSALDRYQTIKTAKKAWRSVQGTEWEKNGWVLAHIGKCGESIFPFQEYAAASSPENMTDTICECYFSDAIRDAPGALIAAEWLEVFGQTFIPFDPDERRMKLQRAYELLEPYMAAFSDAIAVR
jgi:molecular chaperone HtpG